MQTASLAAISKEKYGELTKDKLDDELNNYLEIQDTEQIDSGIVVNFKSGRVYLVDLDGNVSRYSEITIGDLVVKNGNTVVTDGSKSVPLNTALTINFIANISEGSITSISPTLPYTTNGTETSKTFTIIGTGGETKTYTVNLKGYYNIPDLKVGDFVNYILKTPTEAELTQLNNDIATYSGATDNTTKTAVGSTLLCRVLEMDENGEPTKLISANGVNDLKLYGADGYNNGVYLLNEMCEILYSGNDGITTNLKKEEIESKFNETGINLRDNYVDSAYSTSAKYKYEDLVFLRVNYPIIAAEEKDVGVGTPIIDGKNQLRTDGIGSSEQETLYTGSNYASNGITIKQTSYYTSYNGDTARTMYKLVNEQNAYYSIFHTYYERNNTQEKRIDEYWISTRTFGYRPSFDDFGFGLMAVSVDGGSKSCVSNKKMFYTSQGGMCYNQKLAVRPIITLNAGVKAKYKGIFNSMYNEWTLET